MRRFKPQLGSCTTEKKQGVLN